MLFTVNTEVCTRCGLCVADCPTGLLVMTEDGPKTGKGGCISWRRLRQIRKAFPIS